MKRVNVTLGIWAGHPGWRADWTGVAFTGQMQSLGTGPAPPFFDRRDYRLALHATQSGSTVLAIMLDSDRDARTDPSALPWLGTGVGSGPGCLASGLRLSWEG
jgi:hypothetical protein